MCVGLFLGSLFCPIDLHACIYHAVLSFVGWLYILKQDVILICSCSKLLWLLGVFCGSMSFSVVFSISVKNGKGSFLASVYSEGFKSGLIINRISTSQGH